MKWSWAFLVVATACADTGDALAPAPAQDGGVPPRDAGFCEVEAYDDAPRQIPVGAAFGGGCNACFCREAGAECSAAACLPDLPRTCQAQADCPGGACFFDPGCESPRGWCCYTGHCTNPATAPMVEPATYCGCDGHNMAPGPIAPYAHLGACAGALDGAACSTDAECSSGWCVDGVCCESSCRGRCQTCSAVPGLCQAQTGPDPEGGCAECDEAGTGTCLDRRLCTTYLPGPVGGMVSADETSVWVASRSIQQPFGLSLSRVGPACTVMGPLHFPGATVWLNAMTTNALGEVFLAGGFRESVTFGDAMLSAAESATFVARLGPGGDHRSSFVLPARGLEIRDMVATDASDIILAGVYSGLTDFGDGPLVPQLHGAFVVRLAPDGGVRWARTFDGSGFDEASALALSPTGEILVAGHHGEDLELDQDHRLTGEGAFLMALDTGGRLLWSRALGQTYRLVSRMRFDPAGDLVVAGAIAGREDLGAGPLVSAGSFDVLVAKLRPPDTTLWSRTFGGSGTEVLQGLDVGLAGDIRLSAGHLAYVDPGPGQPVLPGRGVFTLHLTPAGDVLSADAFPELSWDLPAPVLGRLVTGALGYDGDTLLVELTGD